MLSLILVTISAGILDSFNPVALTQQFVLQGLVKKRHHILFYSVAVGVTNLIVGLLVYYGLYAVITTYWADFSAKFSWAFVAVEYLLAMTALVYVGYHRMNKKVTAIRRELECLPIEGDCEEEAAREAAAKIKSVSPPALVLFGVFAEICEIPTALPYLTFIAVLLSYDLSLPVLLGILLVYNLLFTLPLYLLFGLSIRCGDKVDRVYHFLKDKLFRYGTVLLPVLASAIAVVLVFHATFTLFFR